LITIQAGYALVIDDEPGNRDFLERLLQTASFKVLGASSGEEALKAAKSVPQLALALVDQQLPDATGLDIIASLRADNPEALLIMATMHDDRTLIDQAFLKGADVFLVKPHGFMELFRRLKEVDSNTSLLRRLVIDQYGPRPYKGTGELKLMQNKPVTKPLSPLPASIANSPPGTAVSVPPGSAAAVTKPSKPPVPIIAPPKPGEPGLPAGPTTGPTQALNRDETLPHRPESGQADIKPLA
jgi:CheY-like chemotaxis protein